MAEKQSSGETRGFTLIEVMLVVTIVALLATLAIYGVRKYLLNAKTAECRNTLGDLAKAAKTAYEPERLPAQVLAGMPASGPLNNFCRDATYSVPRSKDLIAGTKYQSSRDEWLVDGPLFKPGPRGDGFACLHFSMSDPQYFMYDYKGTLGETGTFVATGMGDLDADGFTSTFSLRGALSGGMVLVSPNFEEDKPEE